MSAGAVVVNPASFVDPLVHLYLPEQALLPAVAAEAAVGLLGQVPNLRRGVSEQPT